jgi:hypothetical protein
VDQAYAAFLAVVDRALAENGITAEAADDVVGRVDVAMEAHARGDPERALHALDEARNALAGHAAEGRLEPEWAGAIAEALDGLDTALMSAGPVPPKDEDEDKGDGGGKGKGKGKGNGDGDGESDD